MDHMVTTSSNPSFPALEQSKATIEILQQTVVVTVGPEPVSAYFDSVIKTASLVNGPRARARRFPSCENAKLFMMSDLKSVSCCGLPPSMGICHKLEVRPIVSEYMIDRLSFDQR